jgi:hypothetical protein
MQFDRPRSFWISNLQISGGRHDRGMPQQLLHLWQTHSVLQQIGGTGVTKLMQTDQGYLGFLRMYNIKTLPGEVFSVRAIERASI